MEQGVPAAAPPPSTEEEYAFDEGGRRFPFARGGPIYVPDHVGPITTVMDFKVAVLDELQSLEAELASTSTADFDEELSIGELKIFTEEELVEKAVKEEFEDIPGISRSPRPPDDENKEIANHSCSSETNILCSIKSAGEDTNIESTTTQNNSIIKMCDTDDSKEKNQQKKRKKRGRTFDRNTRAAELEGSYLSKVKKLAIFKQKQDEDKLAARLHSFSGSSKDIEGTISTCDKREKMRSLRFITSPLKMKSSKPQEHVPLFYPEVILCVEIYRNEKSSVKTQELLILGSQSLSDLRDNIYCLTDKLMQTAGENDPSGYFLVEGTFCNDLRDSSAVDYSKPIFDWLRNYKDEVSEKWEHIVSGKLRKNQRELIGDVGTTGTPSFKAVNMHKTRMLDLQFRLGAGYLYCHQGNCKHTIVIRDMRLLHPEDIHNRADYPLLTFQLRSRKKKCSICKIYLATKMTVDDKWAPKNPCYYCIHCYFLLHYKEDNSLMYPHIVFDYYYK